VKDERGSQPVLVVIAVPLAVAIGLAGYATRHHPRYVDKQPGRSNHWQEEHERAKVAQQRMLEGPDPAR
jgi:hypothetical protein